MTSAAVDATKELAAFLRARRESLDPADLGLPPQRKTRRTPGLRREELAELAGISTDYVMRLEQARGVQPSAEVTEALARALRLTPPDRASLFGLTRQRPRRPQGPALRAAPALAELVADLRPRPAMLLNHRYDILAWNEEMAGLMLDFATLAPTWRNAVRLCLLHPQLRDSYLDRDAVVRDGVAHLRAAWARHPDDQVLDDLIAECLVHDEDVARRWSDQAAAPTGRRRKAVRHPEHGVIVTDVEVLLPFDDPDQVVVVHRGADDASREALARLSTE